MLAVDLEADGFHRYPEKVALIQVGLPDGRIYLIDPLALADLSDLGRALAAPEVVKIFHSAAYDVRALERDFGFRIVGLFDTSIAAQYTGAERTGLANVLADELGIEMDNKSKRLQRMDWSRRPLPEDALAYAAEDVYHLFALRSRQIERIDALGRAAWVAEECARQAAVRYDAPAPPEEAFLSVKGARDLSPRGRAILRELYIFREGEALDLGRPPHYVMHNSALIALSAEPDQPLDRLRGLGRRTRERRSRQLRSAVDRGIVAKPVPWPRSGGRNPWTPEARSRLAALKRWRTAEAATLELPAGLVWPARHLDQVALEPSADLRRLDRGVDQAGEPPWVREWQWAELGESLAEFLSAKRWLES